MKSPLRAAAFAGLVAGALAAPASAHDAGDWILKAGVHRVAPKSDNGGVLGGAARLDVDASTRPTLSLTYMATRHVGVDLLAALPFRHDIALSEAVDGKVGSTRQLPPTLSLQYHFLPDARIQPYVGIGINHTRFFRTRASGPLDGASLKIDNSWGPAAQVGVDVMVNEQWMVSADVRYIHIESDVRLNGEKIGKAKVAPWVFGVSVGYRF